jgi:hypothetical protein
MFRNRSFIVTSALVLLAVLILIFGLAVSSAPVAPMSATTDNAIDTGTLLAFHHYRVLVDDNSDIGTLMPFHRYTLSASSDVPTDTGTLLAIQHYRQAHPVTDSANMGTLIEFGRFKAAGRGD